MQQRAFRRRSHQPFPFQPSYGQVFFAVYAVHPLRAGWAPAAFQQRAQTPVAVARFLPRQGDQFAAQLSVVIRTRLIPIRGPIHGYELAGLAFRILKLAPHERHIHVPRDFKPFSGIFFKPASNARRNEIPKPITFANHALEHLRHSPSHKAAIILPEPRHFLHRSACLHLLEHANDLLFRMLALLHLDAPFLAGASQLWLEEIVEGRSG